MRSRAVLLIGVLLAGVAIVGLSFVYPPNDDLFVENPFWNGLSEAYVAVKPVRLGSLSGLDVAVPDPSAGTLLILGPSRAFSAGDVESVRGFLLVGGTVVLADDFGSGNQLLEGLGVGARFSGLLLEDQLFKEMSSVMPTVINIADSRYTGNVSRVIMNYPTIIEGVSEGEALAWSSFISYVGAKVEKPGVGSRYGPFPLLAEVRVGGGRLVLVSDSSLFINGMLELGDNRALLSGLASGRVAIDESHIIPSRLTESKALLVQAYSVLGSAELKYGIAALAVFGVFKVKWGEDDVQGVDEVEEALRRHPEWSREELERLRDLREEHNGRY